MIKKSLNTGRRILSTLLCIGLLFSNVATILAEEESVTPTPDPHTSYYYQEADSNSISGWPKGPQIEGEAAVVMDLDTGCVLYAKNADKKLYPASITKVMTGLLACEKLNMQDELIMTQEAAYGIEPGSSSIYADTNEVFTVEQCVMALMLESANEMALALAAKASGSVKKFIEEMNARARQLGCTNTHFNNPHGLHDDTHYTTARDMAKIAKAAWGNILFRKATSTDLYEIPPTNIQPETRYMLNHHKMMKGRDYAYEGVMAGKTGYTQMAGNTLVTYAKRGKLRLVAVVMNSVGGAWADTAALLDYGFNNFEKICVGSTREPVPVKFSLSERFILKNGGNTYPFYYTKSIYVTLPIGTDSKQVKRKSSLQKNVAGMDWLLWEITYNDHLVGSQKQYQRNVLADLLVEPFL